MKPSRLIFIAALCAVAITAALLLRKTPRSDVRIMTRQDQLRQVLFEELQPVRLVNCDLQRFGEPHDGGYMLCGNLLGSIAAGYSYGISGYDGWGCGVSRRLGIRVHQYDCFNTQRPACPGGDTLFHEECVAAERKVDDGRLFDTIQNQTINNGDGEKRVVLKIDVEGAEWDSFLKAPDALFERIEQITVEFHGVGEDRFIAVVWKLKEFFFVANLHFNNFSCSNDIAPFPAWAYEVLFVNKRLGVLDSSTTVVRTNPLDAPNNPTADDCQAARP